MNTIRTFARRVAGPLLAAALLLGLGGCATVSGKLTARDPWEPLNRGVSQFNDGLDAVLLKPVATLYKQGVPPLVRTGVANFFGNLSDAWSFVNNLLQFKLLNAEESLARFHINTMFGVFGIFDVASELNIDRHTEDFGQTLGHWGVPAGPYLVLPFFGPSTLRDTAAMPIDRRLDLVQRIHPDSTRNATYFLRAVDKRANLLRVGDVVEEAALDKYSFVRDSHLQRRRAQVFEREDDPRAIPPPLPEEQTGTRPATPNQPPATPAR
ncbi:VacJ family lipoprotein [Caenimonas sedimenti]|uniref:VacJ family lipoprotein n=1 Tax=Caenimonas sedimenti TaxID=2596921 RepID=A0A562ZHH1_9BURK|nr:VacJ family lipoprotein [Caenimonas sedimenti]TWO67851.1 VacJ family lipoprotein [Caenimonas sedimenti]